MFTKSYDNKKENPMNWNKYGDCDGQLNLFDFIAPTKTIYEAKDFITEIVIHGSGFQNGKQRIKALYDTGMTAQDRAKRIKAEYGQGGCGWPLEGYGLHGYNTFKGNGITAEWNDEEGERKEGLISWKDIEAEIHRLVLVNEYITEKDIRYNH